MHDQSKIKETILMTVLITIVSAGAWQLAYGGSSDNLEHDRTHANEFVLSSTGAQ